MAAIGGHRRDRKAHGSRYAAALLCLATGFTLASCADFKRDVGIDPTSPDEFAVESRAPLTIPPDYDLRPPQPGASRPQERSAEQQARQDLEKAGPGQPGDQAAPAKLPSLAGGSGERVDPNGKVEPNSLSAQLLDYGGTTAPVAKRSTETLKNIY